MAAWCRCAHMNRREFLASSLAIAAVPIPFPSASKYDLVIKGGRVLDGSQKIDRTMDVAIRQGKIAVLQPDIPASDASEVFDETDLDIPAFIREHKAKQ